MTNAATAHHEAGHVVAMHAQRIKVQRATIAPAAEYEGRVTHHRSPALLRGISDARLSNRQVEAHVLVFLAGPEAERKFAGRYSHVGARDDRDKAVELLTRHSGSDEEVRAWFRLRVVRARLLVEHHSEEIRVVAKALRERQTLTGSDVRAILR